MKKRKMSYRTARLVLESAEVQVPVEVDQQYNIVTAMDGIELNSGTMVNVTKVTDKQIEFKVVDTESTYSTDYDTFVTHCQLQSNNVNESFVDESIDKAKVSKLVGSIYDYGNEGHEQKLIPTYKKIAKRANLENADYKKIISAANEEELQDLYKVAMSQAKAIAKAEKYSGVSDSDRDKMKALLEKEFVNESFVDEALSLADTARLTTIISSTYAMVNYAHVLHNNDFDAPNVNAVHLALETLYTELPALADELGEACRFDYDITLDSSVVINEANPVKACFDLRNDLLSLQKDMPGYINSMIDAVNALLTSVMYKMVRLGGLTKPTITVVNEAEARGWSEYSTQERLNALKLAIMSDGLAYDAEDYVGKDLKDMPKELQVALEVVTAVNESFINEGYSAKAYNKVIDSMTVEEIIDIMSKFDDKIKDMRKTDKGSLTMIATHVRKPSDMGPAKEVKEYILKKYEDKLKKADELMSATKPGKPADGSGRLNECDESEAQDAYREFFRAKLEEFGVKSPAELSEDQKKDFFNQIKAEWPDAKAEMLNEGSKSYAELWNTMSKKDKIAISKELGYRLADNIYDTKFENLDDEEVNMDIIMHILSRCRDYSESKESDEANKVAFARAYADCNDIKKIQKIDEILLKAGQRVSTSIDVAFAAVKPEVQKELCKIVGIDWMNESFINEGYSAKAYNKVIDSMTVEEIIDIMSKFDDKIKDMRKTDKGSLTMIATHVRKPSDMGPAKEVKEYILKKYEDKLKKADELMSATKPGKPADGSGRINESLSLSKKRSVIAALKYVNEELEVGAELKCLKDLTTTDGTVIPAGSTVSYTGIDSNTNVATVTFDENSYAVTIPDLTAATQQMGPAI